MCPHIRRSQRARQGRQRRLGVARHLPTRKLDTTFGTGGLASAGYVGGESGTGVALQPDGKIIWVGSQGNPSFPAGGTFGFAVARFNANGSLDTSFGSGGQAGVAFFAPRRCRARTGAFQRQRHPGHQLRNWRDDPLQRRRDHRAGPGRSRQHPHAPQPRRFGLSRQAPRP